MHIFNVGISSSYISEVAAYENPSKTPRITIKVRTFLMPTLKSQNDNISNNKLPACNKTIFLLFDEVRVCTYIFFTFFRKNQDQGPFAVLCLLAIFDLYIT